MGPGAHSYFGGCRFSFKRDIDRYIESMERPDRDYDIIDEKYNISPNDRIGEYVMLHLRTVYGVDTSDFEACFGKSFENMYSAYLNKYIEGGYMKKNGNRYYFTPGGMYVSNYILPICSVLTETCKQRGRWEDAVACERAIYRIYKKRKANSG